jgi:hypothetical protein
MPASRGVRGSRIFISHSAADNAEAIALRDWLKSEGWSDLFLDLDPDRGIAAGERWERALIDAARRCEAVLFLISKAWLASRWCMNELTLARQGTSAMSLHPEGRNDLNRIVRCWDGSRAAARAINDALPLLQRARAVVNGHAVLPWPLPVLDPQRKSAGLANCQVIVTWLSCA